jgi:hypothetical protein
MFFCWAVSSPWGLVVRCARLELIVYAAVIVIMFAIVVNAGVIVVVLCVVCVCFLRKGCSKQAP